jgi:hypothetical protein
MAGGTCCPGLVEDDGATAGIPFFFCCGNEGGGIFFEELLKETDLRVSLDRERGQNND